MNFLTAAGLARGPQALMLCTFAYRLSQALFAMCAAFAAKSASHHSLGLQQLLRAVPCQ